MVIDLVDWPYLFIRDAIDLIIDLIINRAILIERKVVIDFSRLFL